MEPVVAVFDPFHPYVTAFIEACYREWGLRSVCLYTDRRERLRSAGSQPVVLTDAVAAHYYVDLARPVEIVEQLSRRHVIRGLIPHHEPYVIPAARMAQALDLPWPDPSVMALFRDKHALKSTVRAAGGPRVNATALVHGVDDVLAAIGTGDYERFVLKPNSGMGNHAIGFFEAGVTRSDLEDYFGSTDPGSVIMEAFLSGQEYCVNGQVDDRGMARTLSVMRTNHLSANGRDQLASSFELVAHHDPLFGMLERYASGIVTAVGLTRSPFHMEVMVDDRGPCLIEVAARIAGAGQTSTIGIAHGRRLNAFTLAASGYTGLAPGASGEPDWAAYDASMIRTVCGVGAYEERITRMLGVGQAEAMPEFVEWVFKPQVGQMAHRTTDLGTVPWIATIAAADSKALDRAEDRLRRMLVCNPPPQSGAETAARAVSMLAARVQTRARAIPQLLLARPISLESDRRRSPVSLLRRSS